MKLNLSSNISFQRAFTTKEKKEYSKVQKEARDELGLNETSVIAFDFNFPAKNGYNWGIGTINSDNSIKFADFLKEISGISKIQTGPQSELMYHSNGSTFIPTTSPYSGTTFTLGRHSIDLEKLTKDEWGNLLSDEYVKNLDINYPNSKETRSYKTDYEYALGNKKDGVVFEALRKALSNLENGVQDGNENCIKLNNEYIAFKNNMSDEMKKDVIFDTLSNIYHKKGKKGTEPKEWNYIDRYLFSSKVNAQDREKRIKELDKDSEFVKFGQFLAHKQHMETKDKLNKEGIKLFGDCLVCFSNKEVWANPDCFQEGWYTGGKDPFCSETNGIQTWASPALDYTKLGKYDSNGEIISLDKTGELLYNKFKNFMELYDGIRIDAFWQYVSPFVYNNNLEGLDVEDIDTKIIKIMEKASVDTFGECDPNRFVLELIGFNTDKGRALTINNFPHVYSTAYAEYNENPLDLINNRGYKDGYFIIGATSHDNDSLVNMSRNKERVEAHIPILKRNLKEGYNHLSYDSKNYQSLSKKEKEEQDFRTAKIAEIFTSKNQYYTLPDFFGMSERINISGKNDVNNWSVRMPENYEEFYYNQLSKGFGVNIPKSYEVALYAKNSKNKELINKLHKFSEILASSGPMTTKEADIEEKEGKLNTYI